MKLKKISTHNFSCSRNKLYLIIILIMGFILIISKIRCFSYDKSIKEVEAKIAAENCKNIKLENIKHESYGVYDIIEAVKQFKDLKIENFETDGQNNKVININVEYFGDIKKFSNELIQIKNIENFIGANNIAIQREGSDYRINCKLQFKRD